MNQVTPYARLDQNRFIGGKFGSVHRTLIGNVTLNVADPFMHFLNPNGADRTVTMFPLSSGEDLRIIANVGSANNIIVVTSIGAAIATLAAGETGLFIGSASEWASMRSNGGATYASVQATGLQPTLTASLAGVMMGLAVPFIPRGNGKVLIKINGQLSNSISGSGYAAQIHHGTGVAPTNGAASAGTLDGTAFSGNVAAASQQMPFETSTLLTGLTIGTTYWIDLLLVALTSGNAAAQNVNVIAVELP